MLEEIRARKFLNSRLLEWLSTCETYSTELPRKSRLFAHEQGPMAGWLVGWLARNFHVDPPICTRAFGISSDTTNSPDRGSADLTIPGIMVHRSRRRTVKLLPRNFTRDELRPEETTRISKWITGESIIGCPKKLYDSKTKKAKNFFFNSLRDAHLLLVRRNLSVTC